MKVAVIIPSYKVRQHILKVLLPLVASNIVDEIVVVDDCCPEETGNFVLSARVSEKVTVIFNDVNVGVGGATLAGYAEAYRLNCDIFVKMDGDDQMDPRELPSLIAPILTGRADYTKGNRFFSPSFLRSMPKLRLFGNSILSFVSKACSGYWNVMDPTNGYTAIHSKVYRLLFTSQINNRYFFESDILFRLGILRAVIKDVPISSRYANERSNMSIRRVAFTFPFLYLKCFLKRVFYLYFLRDFNAGSIQLLLSIPMILFGISYGAFEWSNGARQGLEASSGTVMLSALPIILGFQLLLGFLLFDVGNVPQEILHSAILDDKNDSK